MIKNVAACLEGYLEKLKAVFGSRLQFVGLQGSYGRGEASESSDIDIVVILDQVVPEDLRKYSLMLDTFPNRESACGFISGSKELLHWERSDLFQFYHDTTPVMGSIDYLLALISKEDIRRAVRMGACNIYHICGHNMVHHKDEETLKALYKSAAFTVQAVHYNQVGIYLKRKAELLPQLQPQEYEILQACILIKEKPDMAQHEFNRLSDQLFQWSATLIEQYKVE
jgi:predicted nucleotidyltransferase